MRVFKILKIAMAAIYAAVILPIVAIAGVPEVSHVMITDVTTVSFSVIWAASEESTADLVVYEDAVGTSPVASAVITPHPVNCGDLTIKTEAEKNGVMKVRVTGLDACTTYYFRTATTSKSTNETAYFPTSDLMAVATEIVTTRSINNGGDEVPFSNDIIIEPCYLEDADPTDEFSPPIAEGTLLLATVEGADYPLTSFVGDGVDPPYALIDLNNAFDRDTHENLDLSQGKNLTLLNFRGWEGGYSIITYNVPEDDSLCEVKQCEYRLQAGRNLVSFQLEPNNPDISKVLGPILDSVISAWAFDTDLNDWVFFVKDGLPFLNNFNSIYAYTGFYLYLSDPNSCLLNGSIGDGAVPLKAGRNLVGYHSIETLPIESLESKSIYDQLISIWTFDTDLNDWVFYVKDGLPFLNSLNQIEPGKAYWVYVENDCIW